MIPSSHHTQKINSRRITELNEKGKMIKLFKNNIAYVHGLRVGKEFLRHKKHKPQRKRLIN